MSVNINDEKLYKSCRKKQYLAQVCRPPLYTVVANKVEHPESIKALKSMGYTDFIPAKDIQKMKANGDARLGSIMQAVQNGIIQMTDNGTEFVVCGTLGELSVISPNQLASGYNFIVNNQPASITNTIVGKLADKSGRMKWHRVQSKPVAGVSNLMALFVPKSQKLRVSNASSVMVANESGIDHGKGDFIVCPKLPNGKPNLRERIVVNGNTFATTYNNQGWSQDLNPRYTGEGYNGVSVHKELFEASEMDENKEQLFEDFFSPSGKYYKHIVSWLVVKDNNKLNGKIYAGRQVSVKENFPLTNSQIFVPREMEGKVAKQPLGNTLYTDYYMQYGDTWYVLISKNGEAIFLPYYSPPDAQYCEVNAIIPKDTPVVEYGEVIGVQELGNILGTVESKFKALFNCGVSGISKDGNEACVVAISGINDDSMAYWCLPFKGYRYNGKEQIIVGLSAIGGRPDNIISNLSNGYSPVTIKYAPDSSNDYNCIFFGEVTKFIDNFYDIVLRWLLNNEDIKDYQLVTQSYLFMEVLFKMRYGLDVVGDSIDVNKEIAPIDGYSAAGNFGVRGVFNGDNDDKIKLYLNFRVNLSKKGSKFSAKPMIEMKGRTQGLTMDRRIEVPISFFTNLLLKHISSGQRLSREDKSKAVSSIQVRDRIKEEQIVLFEKQLDCMYGGLLQTMETYLWEDLHLSPLRCFVKEFNRQLRTKVGVIYKNTATEGTDYSERWNGDALGLIDGLTNMSEVNGILNKAIQGIGGSLYGLCYAQFDYNDSVFALARLRTEIEDSNGQTYHSANMVLGVVISGGKVAKLELLKNTGKSYRGTKSCTDFVKKLIAGSNEVVDV